MSLKDIRKQVMKQRGKEFKRLTRQPVSIDETPAPYHKSNLMRLIEVKHKNTLDNLIYKGTIYEVEKRLGVDATTISKWRRIITKARDKEFFDSFKSTKQLAAEGDASIRGNEIQSTK